MLKNIKMHIYNYFLSICIFLFFIQNTTAQPPNFVIIVVDDQGWTGSSVQMDASVLGSKSDYYFTPELELLAQSGMTFSQGYAPAPKCSPTRNSILTGKTPARTNFTNTSGAIASGKILIETSSNTALDGAEITYAEWLKSIGMNYRTAHFGKWHLGNTSSSPANNGFDFNDGATKNNDGNQGVTVQADPKKIFDLTNRSIAFMQDAVTDGVPFCLQLSHYAVHGSIEARQTTIDLYNNPALRPPGTIHTTGNAEYGAMTEDTDDGIGQLLDEITNLGIDNNTYVIFISDNGGPMNLTDNAPLSFGKTFIYEGGIRVPFIIKGPGISPNTYNTEPVVAYDLFPTIAELTGSTTTLPANLDGQSIVPLLTGSSFTRSALIYFHSPHYSNNINKTPRSALVSGNYKLMVEYETSNIYLFDLSTDIGESNDLSASQPALRLNLIIQLRDYLKSVNASMPSLNPSHANFSGTAPDVDGDGLNDEWEFRELLTYAYGPNDDPDNDGDTNLTEFINGTDPYINVLPVELLSFKAIQKDNIVICKWTTAVEMNNDYFILEKSYDGLEWREIGRVNGAGHSLAELSYEFIDVEPIIDIQYYRLKQIDFNGQYSYSNVETINFALDKLLDIQLYPNPAKGYVRIKLEGSIVSDEIKSIKVYDSNAQLVYHSLEPKEIIELSKLNKGIYFIQIDLEKGQMTQKIIIN